MSAKLGIKAKVYRLSTGTRATWGTADTDGIHKGAAPADLTEITQASETTLNLDKGEATANVRGNAGWEASLGANKKASLDINTVYDDADPHFAALMGAYLNDTNVALAVLSGDKATADVMGLWADWQVLKLVKGEPEEGVQTAVWTVKPALTDVPPEWVRVTGGS